MKKSISFPGYTAILMIAGILSTSYGCKKNSTETTTTTTGDLQVVPRESAYPGCYPLVGTSQTKCWDSAGNIITPALVVAECRSAFEAMEIISNRAIQLIFIDINMPVNGLEFVKSLTDKPHIVFTTA